MLELAVLALILAVFAYMLWFDPSFRWSIFEERDFLEARQVITKLIFPIYGPELLMGGHTIGGGLYLFLAPVVAIWNDPEALRLLNQVLFLGMAGVLWWGLRDWTGPAGALFAVLALVASERIVALSYWPIHPNFSLFFAFLYAAAALRGVVGGHAGWLIFSGLLLGFLVELHFSYFLLVICHIVLVVFGYAQRQRWMKPLAVAAVFVPLLPSLAADAVHGFPNIAQILERPRFHGLYPDRLFGNAGLLALVLGWVRQPSGALSQPFSQLVVVLIGVGLAVGVGSAAAAARTGRAGMTAATAVTLLLCVPLVTLTVMGMGYNSRHTLAIAPALFMLAGIGFAGIVALLRPAKPWLAPAGLLLLLLVVGWRAADSAGMTRITRSEGEWAIDYKSRETIARDLALRLGVTPEIYARRSFWWWVGWSIDPEIYANIYRRATHGRQATPPLPPDQYVLVVEQAELPPFLKAVFDSLSSRPVAGMHVHVARPKAELAGLSPSSNADTGVRLHPFLQDVDLVRHRQDGFHRIAEHRAAGTRRNLYLGFMAQGRIKVLVATDETQVGNRSRLRWCVDSPSLNGHYQEIKTVWRPRLVLAPQGAAPVQAALSGEVLGSLPFKAPRCGEAWSEQAGNAPASWQASFAVDGMFDQSFMAAPGPDAAAVAARSGRSAPAGAGGAEGRQRLAAVAFRSLSSIGVWRRGMAVDPKQFWEDKLLVWEQGRYGRPDRPLGPLEWIANRSSMSLRYRIAVTPELLEPFLAGKRVVELGCGSGLLAGKFIERGAASYHGIDIAESAIAKALESHAGGDGRITFAVGGVSDLPPLAADLVVSLGLFDWLRDDEIANVFAKSGRADFLHAIAERRPGIQQWLHRSYVQLAYGYRTDTYRPRYFTCGHIGALATAVVDRPLYVYRNWQLSFGALISSLPIGAMLGD